MTDAAGTEPPEQRRILRVLIAAQILSGAGLAAGITVGALLAQDMLNTTGLAGLPAALFTVGSAAAAAGVGRLSDRAGRRAGLARGYAPGAPRRTCGPAPRAPTGPIRPGGVVR